MRALDDLQANSATTKNTIRATRDRHADFEVSALPTASSQFHLAHAHEAEPDPGRDEPQGQRDDDDPGR